MIDVSAQLMDGLLDWMGVEDFATPPQETSFTHFFKTNKIHVLLTYTFQICIHV